MLRVSELWGHEWLFVSRGRRLKLYKITQDN